ncbi:prenyltransferase/squalene oxidase repeat-containing protein [Zavarzinella formosa]|uniref:prenyltransferase/squalene oxidase repeat-containing protein n=1 Tax=Zavarzinella formosa TaxID=360055 RepID=UPI0002E8B6CA|nr:prenyltransferase/squalene oxidase repeat-containing protein [Zavarzinella formosa]
MKRFCIAITGAFAMIAVLASSSPESMTAQEKKDETKQKKDGPKGKSWEQLTTAAAAYLKSTQADDGSLSKTAHPGITAVVLNGMLKSGVITADDPVATKGLKFIEGYVNSKEGHIAGQGDDFRHKFYTTSVNIQALKSSGLKKYDPVVENAISYLRKGQVGGVDGKKDDDMNYGGFGYGPNTRGDLSNTHFALDASVAAGVARDDVIFKHALVFVGRMQNFKSEANTQPWAGKINDGSFIYVLAAGNKGGATDEVAARPGYGSMTYAGLKSLVYCGVGKDDPRYKKAMEWVSKNYSVDINPGRQEGAGGQGFYYYLVAMARCFEAMGIDEITDVNGKAHDWRADITRALANRQKKDGSWSNDFATWMEGDPNLDTAYALIALSHAKPKAK